MIDIQDPVAAPGRSLTRRVGRGMLIGLGILFAISILAVLLNAALLVMFDNAQQWQAWRTDHYWSLFTWRLTLYAALAVAWLNLKARLPQSERTKRRKGLLKIEVMVVLLFLMVELSKALFQTGGAL